MKKLTIRIIAAFFLLSLVPSLSKAREEKVSTTLPVSKSAESSKATTLLYRLNEIKEMDKSTLTASAKKQLRKEVRSTKKQLKEMGGGVYLSVGAIIIIILLLILLL